MKKVLANAIESIDRGKRRSASPKMLFDTDIQRSNPRQKIVIITVYQNVKQPLEK